MGWLADWMWGRRAKFAYLLGAAIVLLLTFLGTKDIWTQEHRWADIVSGMFFRQDFLHPYLNDISYYDKPLLSYWLMSAFAFISGEVSSWSLRLPSALAGLLAVWSVYSLGATLKNKQLGLLAGWLLLTSFYFIFWARTSSADMLNMAGIIFAVSWYFAKKSQTSFFNYAIFFLILALTSLCKGIVAFVVALIAIFPDLIRNGEWKKHLNFKIIFAFIPAIVIFYLPFWASSHFGTENYQQKGLSLVYQENVLRYFKPFDHMGPIYTYLVFLPIYLLPWAVFFIPALISLKSRWKDMPGYSKWLVWVVVLLFLFFTLSGSRRNYYVLPLIPFAILMTADWLLTTKKGISKAVPYLVLFFFILFFISFDVVQPLFYSKGGVQDFAKELKAEVTKIKPWTEWQFVMIDPESKTRFYLQLPPSVKNFNVNGKQREKQTTESLLKTCPLLNEHNPNIIFITRRLYKPLLANILSGHAIVEVPPNLGERLVQNTNLNDPIAFVPKPSSKLPPI